MSGIETVIVFGVRYHRKSDIDKIVDRSYNVKHVTGPESNNLFDFANITGMDDGFQNYIETKGRWSNTRDQIELDNYKTIAIYCNKGRHRSVSCAELLKKRWPQIQIKYLDQKYWYDLMRLATYVVSTTATLRRQQPHED